MKTKIGLDNQVDNRTGWLESVTLQLGPTSHAQLICYKQH